MFRPVDDVCCDLLNPLLGNVSDNDDDENDCEDVFWSVDVVSEEIGLGRTLPRKIIKKIIERESNLDIQFQGPKLRYFSRLHPKALNVVVVIVTLAIVAVSLSLKY